MTKLNDGEYYCPECKGKTLVIQTEYLKSGSNKLMACPICLGTGKLDWIDFTKGKKDLTLLADYRQSYWKSRRKELLFAKKNISKREFLYAQNRERGLIGG